MMTNLEKLKLKSELLRVQSGKAEQEFNIAQREEEIDRLKKAVLIQDEKILELEEKLKEV